LSILFPEETYRKLPPSVIYELNTLLDESTPLPRRVALVMKYSAILRAWGSNIRVPRYEDITPAKLREISEKILHEIATRLSA